MVVFLMQVGYDSLFPIHLTKACADASINN